MEDEGSGQEMVDFDDVLKYSIGDFGIFQLLVLLLFFVPDLFVNGQVIGTVFFASKPEDFWCNSWHQQNCSEWDMTPSECNTIKRDISIPISTKSERNGTYEQCAKYNESGIPFSIFWDYKNETTEVIPCDEGWVYNATDGRTTIVTEFDLVCQKDSYANIDQSVFFSGFLLGSIFFGALSDRIGRRIPLMIVLTVYSVCGTLTAFAPDFWTFIALRFVVASAVAGKNLCGFSYVSEVIGTSKRAIVGNFLWLFASFGYLMTAGLAYVIKEWRMLLLVGSAPIFLTLLFFPFFPESPRWLLAKKKLDKAEKAIKQIASCNGKKYMGGDLRSLISEVPGKKTTSKDGAKSMLKSKILMFRQINLMFNWAVQCAVYYGIALFANDLGINVYLTFTLLGLVELPSYVVTVVIMDLIGRRLSLSLTMLISGCATIAIILFPPGLFRTIFAIVGKFGACASFGIVYILTAEMLPTPLRATGIGLCSCSSRIGGILAPLIIYLDTYVSWLSMTVFGSCAIMAGLLSLLFPETLGKPLPDTIESAENIGRSSVEVKPENRLTSGVVNA